METSFCSIFLVNLLQDVNILRPLIRMSAVDESIPTEIMISKKFVIRDSSGVWETEIKELCADVGAILTIYENVSNARNWLEGKGGFIFAGSESNLDAHDMTRDVFRCAPPSFTRITLQHGYECVGMLQSKQHNIAHGKGVYFSADIVCGWFRDNRMMRSMLAHQRPKVFPTGPTCVLQQHSSNSSDVPIFDHGIICENLHSTRLNVSGDLKIAFIAQFEAFCKALKKKKKKVALRPHPGGQYVVKNKLPLPANVTLVNAPIYKVDLKAYNYGISAPSSVLIDMLLAGIPTAVWRDSEGVMDSDNYSGLTEVSSLEDWLFFAEDAVRNKEKYLARQQKFLNALNLISDKSQVYGNYRSLFNSKSKSPALTQNEKPRVAYIANSMVPTLQLSFLKPFNLETGPKKLEEFFILESEFNELFDKGEDIDVCAHIGRKLSEYSPSILVFCRYSGPHAVFMLLWAKQRGIPTIYHVDDDLLSIPSDIGIKKYQYHNSSERIKAVRYLMDHVDYLYCSTERLLNRFDELGIASKKEAGKIYCSGSTIVSAKNCKTTKIGYMASADHSHNMKVVLPALVRLLNKHSNLEIEFFGSIPVPNELKKFKHRITTAPPVRDYENFLQEFSKRNWDVGICPLTPIHFNLMKANTKWIEYTSVGAAVVASKGTVYDECCSDDCGLLASSEEEWFEHLNKLVEDAEYRYKIVLNAQQKLETQYSVEKLQKQVLDIFERARCSMEERLIGAEY